MTMVNSFLVMVSLFYTQAYLTCLPAISHDLSSSPLLIQLAFTGNIFCLGVSQLFYGSFSDYYGRKKCLLIGLWITLAGNIFSMFALNAIMLCIGQCIAGLGAGACSVIPRTILKDVFADVSLVKAISYLSIASTIATGIAPTLGSLFQLTLGWRSIFFCLIGLTVLALILTNFIPETLKKIDHNYLTLRIIKNFKMLFLNRIFLTYTIINSYAYSGIIIYLIFSPFLFQTIFNYSGKQNSFIYLLCASSYLFGNILLNKLIESIHIDNTIWLGILIIIMGSSFVLLPGMMSQKISVIGLILCGVLIHFGSGLITPITYKQVLSIPEFPAGITASAINSTRVFIAFIFSLFATSFSLRNPVILADILGILSLICIGVYSLLLRNEYYTEETT